MYSGTLRVICGSCILAPKCLVFGSCILSPQVSCVRRAFWHPRRLVRVVSCDMLRVQCESCVFCHPMVQRVLCIRTSYVSCVFQHPIVRVMCILTCHVCVVCVSCVCREGRQDRLQGVRQGAAPPAAPAEVDSSHSCERLLRESREREAHKTRRVPEYTTLRMLYMCIYIYTFIHIYIYVCVCVSSTHVEQGAQRDATHIIYIHVCMCVVCTCTSRCT